MLEINVMLCYVQVILCSDTKLSMNDSPKIINSDGVNIHLIHTSDKQLRKVFL